MMAASAENCLDMNNNKCIDDYRSKLQRIESRSWVSPASKTASCFVFTVQIHRCDTRPSRHSAAVCRFGYVLSHAADQFFLPTPPSLPFFAAGFFSAPLALPCTAP